MRTQEEITKRFQEKRSELLNFEPEVLCCFMDYEHLRPFLKDGTKKKDVIESIKPTKRNVLNQAKKYMAEYGWDKVLNHRGISAERTIQKMTSWMWLAGEDELLAKMNKTSYENYGAPILMLICKSLGWSIPNDEAAHRMAKGLPCHEGCEEGCGR